MSDDFSSVKEAHTRIIDQVVEVDDELMRATLAGRELAPEQRTIPREGARRGTWCGLRRVGFETVAGIPEVLAAFERLMPNPGRRQPAPFLKGAGDDADRARSHRMQVATRSRTCSQASWIPSSAAGPS